MYYPQSNAELFQDMLFPPVCLLRKISSAKTCEAGDALVEQERAVPPALTHVTLIRGHWDTFCPEVAVPVAQLEWLKLCLLAGLLSPWGWSKGRDGWKFFCTWLKSETWAWALLQLYFKTSHTDTSRWLNLSLRKPSLFLKKKNCNNIWNCDNLLESN